MWLEYAVPKKMQANGEPTREFLDTSARELGLALDAGELESLFNRLQNLKKALTALETLVEPTLGAVPVGDPQRGRVADGGR